MTRLPTSDEQFGVFDENGEGCPLDPIAEEVGFHKDGYSVVSDPGFSLEEDEDA